MTSSLFAGVIALAVLLEGANFLTGGDLQMAALQKIAQAEQQSATAPATTNTSTTATPTTTTQPVTTDTSTGQQPTPPPPERPYVPLVPGEPQSPQQPQPSKEQNGKFFQEPQEREEFIDPKEVKQALREMKDLKSQIRQLSRQVKKLSSAAEEAATLAKISGEIDQFQATISSNMQNSSILRETMQDFRDNQYWETLNGIRAKVELPRELKQILTSLKRVEKILVNKSVQDIGLDIAKTHSSLNLPI